VKINKSVHDDVAVLELVGDFDSFVCPRFTEEIENLTEIGLKKVVLNLRYLRFINSTALGCLVKTKKTLEGKAGDLVIAKPSQFAKSIMTTLGLSDIIRTFPEEENALHHFKAGDEKSVEIEGENVILFQFADSGAGAAFGKPFGVGKITNLVEDSLSFSWDGGKEGADPKTAALFKPGVAMNVKFRLPFYRKSYYFEAACDVTSASKAADGTLAVEMAFREMKPEDRKSIQQFVADMRFLKNEIPGTKR
jgi:anti-anti-sigma factor